MQANKLCGSARLEISLRTLVRWKKCKEDRPWLHACEIKHFQQFFFCKYLFYFTRNNRNGLAHAKSANDKGSSTPVLYVARWLSG